MASQDKVQEILGYLSAVNTLTEIFPFNFNTNYTEYSTSFDFMIDILKLLGVDNRAIVQKIASLVADDSEGGFLHSLEFIVKNVLKLNVSKLLSCEANPFIPDTLIGTPIDDENGGFKMDFGNETYGLDSLWGGFDVDSSLIDIMGYLGHSPLSEEGKYFYNDTNYKVNELYKSTDFNTFLWYVINKGLNAPISEREKLTWDNRHLMKLTERDDDYKDKWFKNENKSRKKIIDVVYRDNGTTATNKINIKINPETYYKKGILNHNKTIFEFNNDYIDSLKLFDSKVILTSLVDVFTNSLNVSLGYSINERIIMAQVDQIIKKVERADDTEIDDCYFTFSNDEFNDMLEETELKMMGQKMMNGEFQETYSYNAKELLSSLDTISNAATLQEKNTAIENLFFKISAIPAKDGGIECSDALTLGYDASLLSSLLRAIVYPIVRVMFSPKVILLLQINAVVMGNEIPSKQEFMFAIFGILKNEIKLIKDMILDAILEWLIEKLKPLLDIFASKVLLETLNEYRAILEILLGCISFAKFGSNQQFNTIDDVNYADITPIVNSPDNNNGNGNRC